MTASILLQFVLYFFMNEIYRPENIKLKKLKQNWSITSMPEDRPFETRARLRADDRHFQKYEQPKLYAITTGELASSKCRVHRFANTAHHITKTKHWVDFIATLSTRTLTNRTPATDRIYDTAKLLLNKLSWIAKEERTICYRRQVEALYALRLP